MGTPLAEVLERQCGVVCRRQLADLGYQPHDLERMLRRRDLTRLVPGVYVDHTGQPTWLQRAWAGVLAHWPAALAHQSALRATVGPGWRAHSDDGPIRIAVARDRKLKAAPGYLLVRLERFSDRVQWNLSPPRLRLEDATVEVAAACPSELDVIEVLAMACRSRRTTAARLQREVAARTRLCRRRWLQAVITDIADGSCSVLEHAFLHRVERPHGLPRPERQQAEKKAGRWMFRDIDHPVLGLIIELDGRLFHEGIGQRDRDLDRDLDAAAADRRTVRLGWGQVYGRPCHTAGQLAVIMRRLGWTGSPVPCGPACEASPTTRCR